MLDRTLDLAELPEKTADCRIPENVYALGYTSNAENLFNDIQIIWFGTLSGVVEKLKEEFSLFVDDYECNAEIYKDGKRQRYHERCLVKISDGQGASCYLNICVATKSLEIDGVFAFEPIYPENITGKDELLKELREIYRKAKEQA